MKEKVSSEFINLINLETYTKGNGLIISKAPGDKTFIGRAYITSPLIGGGGEFGTIVKNIFKVAPDDSCIQVSLVCSPDREAPQRYMRNKDRGSPTITELVKRQAALLESATTPGWQKDVPMLNVRQVIISLALPTKTIKEDDLEVALHTQNEFLVNLRGCGFSDARICDIETLAGVYRHFANLSDPITPVKLDPTLELKYQVFTPEHYCDPDDRRVATFNDSTYCAAVTVKSYPEKPFYGLMNVVAGAVFNTGTTREGGGQRIMGPYIINTTIRVANQAKEWKRIEDAIKSRLDRPELPIKLGNEDPNAKLHSLQIIKAQCAEDASKFVYVSTNIFLFADSRSDAITAASSVKSTLEKLQFDARHVIHNTFVRWVQTLPLNFSPAIADKMAGEALMSAASACCLLPVYSDSLGNVDSERSPTTGNVFVTRRGSAHFWDCFLSQSNFSGVLAAAPGSGKSFVQQYIIQNALAEGEYVYLLDNGRSTKKFCMAAGGEFNEFGSGTGFQPSLNPFTGLSDEEFDEQQEAITTLLMLMAYRDESIPGGARIAMNEAVKAVWGQKRGSAEIHHVIDSLEIIKSSGSDRDQQNEVITAAMNLIPRLRAFIDSPTRGCYFTGPGTLDPKQQFTVFELAGLGDDEHLKKVVLFFVLYLLKTRVRSVSARKRIIVDEAHDLLKDDAAADCLEGLNLKGRKDKVSVFVIVQSLLKLSETPVGPVLLNQSPWKLILQQEAEEIDQVIERRILTKYAGDAYFNRLIRSVQTNKGKFSEILIIGPQVYEVVRLYVDRFTHMLFSSENEARDTVFELMEQGKTALEAVNIVLNDRTEKRRSFVRDFIDSLRKFDRLEDSEIIEEVRSKL